MDRFPKAVRAALVTLAAAWVVLLVDAGAIAEAASLFAVAESGNPYFVPRHAFLLYVRVPLTTLSACALIAAPGVFLARAVGRGRTLDQLALWGFALSLVVLTVLVAVLTAVGLAPVGRGFATLLLTVSLAALVVLWKGVRTPRPSMADLSSATLLSYVAPAVILLVALAPKFLWESFNGDGAHGFEAARLLLHGPLPFWDSSAGAVSRFPGLTTMLFAFPASWFMRLFGELEAAVRLPFLLHITGLYAAICVLVRAGREAGLGVADRWLVWLGLGAYTMVMAFSATYNPYHADIALPGAQDTLFLACFVGFLATFVSDDRPGMVVFLGLSVAALPSWVALVGLWLVAVALTWRPVPWRRLLFAVALCVVVVVGLAVVPRVAARLALPVPGAEHASGSLIERLAFIRLTDWKRWLYFIVPGGILPAVYLLAWKRQDQVARALALLAIGYFLFFYVQAFTSLHHFLPAAVIPIAVLWRDRSVGTERRRLRLAALATGVVAVFLTLPSHGDIHMRGRQLGYSIEDRRIGYSAADPTIFRSIRLYWDLFPRIVNPDVPDKRYGGSPLVWNYYANRRPAGEDVAYVMAPLDTPPPPGATLAGADKRAALYVVDEETLRRDQVYTEPSSVGKLFAMSEGVLFRAVGVDVDEGVLDLSELLRKLRGQTR